MTLPAIPRCYAGPGAGECPSRAGEGAGPWVWARSHARGRVPLGRTFFTAEQTAQGGSPCGRIVSSPALAERGRTEITSAFETDQLELGLERRVRASDGTDIAVLSFTRERPGPRGHGPARPGAAWLLPPLRCYTNSRDTNAPSLGRRTLPSRDVVRCVKLLSSALPNPYSVGPSLVLVRPGDLARADSWFVRRWPEHFEPSTG